VGLAVDVAIAAACWLHPGLLGGTVGLVGLCPQSRVSWR